MTFRSKNDVIFEFRVKRKSYKKEDYSALKRSSSERGTKKPANPSQCPICKKVAMEQFYLLVLVLRIFKFCILR